MTPKQAYEIIDQLIGEISVKRAVGKARDEAMAILRKLIISKKEEKKEKGEDN